MGAESAGPARRVLVISYVFPPAGGVGVQRMSKLVKHLPGHGWGATVLAASNPSVPQRDEGQVDQHPIEVEVVAVRTLEPPAVAKAAVAAGGQRSWFTGALARAARGLVNVVLSPDPQVLWRPAAGRAGRRALRNRRFDAILATGPPFSSMLLGARLARRSGLPLVLDFRDEWALSSSAWENKGRGRLVLARQRRSQRRCLRAASVAVATTDGSAREVERAAAELGSPVRCLSIPNGFDPDDLDALADVARADVGNGLDRFRLVYAGTLWNLADAGPLVPAVVELGRRDPGGLERMELVVAGRRTPDQERVLDALAAAGLRVARLPLCEHREALRLMASADALLLLGASHPGAERVINAKTFEYLAVGRPILAVGPPGDQWELLAGWDGVWRCPPDDPECIGRALSELLVHPGATPSRPEAQLAPFHRTTTAARFAALLDEVSSS